MFLQLPFLPCLLVLSAFCLLRDRLVKERLEFCLRLASGELVIRRTRCRVSGWCPCQSGRHAADRGAVPIFPNGEHLRRYFKARRLFQVLQIWQSVRQVCFRNRHFKTVLLVVRYRFREQRVVGDQIRENGYVLLDCRYAPTVVRRLHVRLNRVGGFGPVRRHVNVCQRCNALVNVRECLGLCLYLLSGGGLREIGHDVCHCQLNCCPSQPYCRWHCRGWVSFRFPVGFISRAGSSVP